MDFNKSKKLLRIAAVVYWVLALLIYVVAGEAFHSTAVTTEALSPAAALGQMVDGMTVTQRITAPAEQVDGVSLLAATYGRENAGTLRLTVSDGEGRILAQQDADIKDFRESQYMTISLEEPIRTREGETLVLTLTTQGCSEGSAVSFYYGSTVSAGRFDVAQEIAPEDRCTVDGVQGVGRLCVKVSGTRYTSFYQIYWVIVAAAFVAAALVCRVWWKEALQLRSNPLVVVCTVFCRYTFLLKQLILRDFKAKYRRSVLGVAWSFVNPLLTMTVQYVVFSTLFSSDIPNYPVYLLTGIVFFNFFSEVVSLGMNAITGNAALIKKVYMPKYIYPFSRIFSSTINFLIALIPLALVMLLTGAPFRPALILLIFDILCLMAFAAGMVLIMSTAMTFFHDTQFLWSVLSMIWMYLTPLFYPVSIIPERFMFFYQLNPMYQFITFARTCIIDGVSPEPLSYLWCLLSGGLMLLAGLMVFKKQQDKFVLHL